MEYRVVYWEDEEARDAGISELYEIFDDVSEAVETARRLFYKDGFAAVEVEDKNGKLIYHISTDGEGEEDYTKTVSDKDSDIDEKSVAILYNPVVYDDVFAEKTTLAELKKRDEETHEEIAERLRKGEKVFHIGEDPNGWLLYVIDYSSFGARKVIQAVKENMELYKRAFKSDDPIFIAGVLISQIKNGNEKA